MGECEANQNDATRKGHDGAVKCHFAFLLILGGDTSPSQCGANRVREQSDEPRDRFAGERK